MSPQNGVINIFVNTTTSGGTGAGSPGGGGTGGRGGGRSGRGGGRGGGGTTIPRRAPYGSPNNPTFVQGTVSFVRLFSPLLALYAIDRTLRAMGLTSSVLNTWIRALGAVWSAIADTLLLPLMPLFNKLLDISLKSLDWMQKNWPKMIGNIGKYLGDIKDAYGRGGIGGTLKAAGTAIGGFFGLSGGEKIVVLITALFALTKTIEALTWIVKASQIGKVAGPLGSGLAALGGGLLARLGLTLPGGAKSAATTGVLANLSRAAFALPAGALAGLVGAGTAVGAGAWMAMGGPGLNVGYGSNDPGRRGKGMWIQQTPQYNIFNNFNLAQVDELSQANKKIQKQTEDFSKQQYIQSQWMYDVGQ